MVRVYDQFGNSRLTLDVHIRDSKAHLTQDGGGGTGHSGVTCLPAHYH